MSRFNHPIATCNADNLVLTGAIRTDACSLKADSTVRRGELVIMQSGKIIPDTGANPSSVYGIACESLEVSASDQKTEVYVSGEYSLSSVIFPAGKTYADYKEALRNKGIILR